MKTKTIFFGSHYDSLEEYKEWDFPADYDFTKYYAVYTAKMENDKDDEEVLKKIICFGDAAKTRYPVKLCYCYKKHSDILWSVKNSKIVKNEKEFKQFFRETAESVFDDLLNCSRYNNLVYFVFSGNRKDKEECKKFAYEYCGETKFDEENGLVMDIFNAIYQGD